MSSQVVPLNNCPVVRIFWAFIQCSMRERFKEVENRMFLMDHAFSGTKILPQCNMITLYRNESHLPICKSSLNMYPDRLI